MQDFNYLVTSKKSSSFRVEKLIGMFELNEEHLNQRFVGKIEFPQTWNIGLIVGRSGTGKSTIAKNLFKIYQPKIYTKDAVIDDMNENKTVDDIVKTFTSVGFSSPPHWLRPYSVLSNGEKMRVDLAQALLSDENPIVFDEFTSVVDRDVAKIVSMVTAKRIRQLDKKFVAVTCHYDVAEWLEPDWIFSTDEMKMIDVKKNGQKFNYKFIEDHTMIGDCLKTIII